MLQVFWVKKSREPPNGVRQEGVVATLTCFAMPSGDRVPFTQWFRVDGAKSTPSRVIYDRRQSLEPGAVMP